MELPTNLENFLRITRGIQSYRMFMFLSFVKIYMQFLVICHNPCTDEGEFGVAESTNLKPPKNRPMRDLNIGCLPCGANRACKYNKKKINYKYVRLQKLTYIHTCRSYVHMLRDHVFGSQRVIVVNVVEVARALADSSDFGL